jgi:hypothetical protein
MDNPTTATLDFGARLRRSEGRSGRNFSASLKLSKEELGEVEEAAKSVQKSVGEYAREAVLREARKGHTDPLFTEIIAMRMLLNLVLKHVACGEVMTDAVFDGALTKIRLGKHKAAADVMVQYAAPDQKEI